MRAKPDRSDLSLLAFSLSSCCFCLPWKKMPLHSRSLQRTGPYITVVLLGCVAADTFFRFSFHIDLPVGRVFQPKPIIRFGIIPIHLVHHGRRNEFLIRRVILLSNSAYDRPQTTRQRETKKMKKNDPAFMRAAPFIEPTLGGKTSEFARSRRLRNTGLNITGRRDAC